MSCLNYGDLMQSYKRNLKEKVSNRIPTNKDPTVSVKIKLASTSENVPLDMCTPRIFRSSCALAQSEENLHLIHFGQGRMQSFFMRTTNTLIRLRMHLLIEVFVGRTCQKVRFLTVWPKSNSADTALKKKDIASWFVLYWLCVNGDE